MDIGPDDRILVITSAGCNALDYLLDSPMSVHAIDANPRQNALLELKAAGIRTLDYEDFFKIFGDGIPTVWRSEFAYICIYVYIYIYIYMFICMYV